MKLKRVIPIAVLTFVLGSCAAFAGTTNSFSDLKTTHWAFKNVNSLVDKGIINGYPDGSFKPGKEVNAAEFLKMAFVAADIPVNTSTSSAWGTPYYEEGLAQGLFEKTDLSEYALYNPIPRAKMAKILSGLMGEQNLSDYHGTVKDLTDISSSTKYEFDISKVYNLGLITGYEDGTFRPEGTLTRAEAASVINRLYENKGLINREKSVEEPIKEEIREEKDEGVFVGDYIKNLDEDLPEGREGMETWKKELVYVFHQDFSKIRVYEKDWRDYKFSSIIIGKENNKNEHYGQNLGQGYRSASLGGYGAYYLKDKRIIKYVPDPSGTEFYFYEGRNCPKPEDIDAFMFMKGPYELIVIESPYIQPDFKPYTTPNPYPADRYQFEEEREEQSNIYENL